MKRWLVFLIWSGFVAASTCLVEFGFVASAPGRLVSTAYADNSIPTGCPGSTSPASTGNYPSTCAQIPLGCPGSTLQGPPSAGFDPSKDCPYDANGNVINANLVPGADNCGGVSVGVKVGCDSSTDNPIYVYLRAIIKFVGGAIGLGVVLMIIVSGIQYMVSAGNPGAVAAAKGRLSNAILGLVLFILLFGIMNYLIPGGVLK